MTFILPSSFRLDYFPYSELFIDFFIIIIIDCVSSSSVSHPALLPGLLLGGSD